MTMPGLPVIGAAGWGTTLNSALNGEYVRREPTLNDYSSWYCPVAANGSGGVTGVTGFVHTSGFTASTHVSLTSGSPDQLIVADAGVYVVTLSVSALSAPVASGAEFIIEPTYDNFGAYGGPAILPNLFVGVQAQVFGIDVEHPSGGMPIYFVANDGIDFYVRQSATSPSFVLNVDLVKVA